ncbi:MAG TPA: AtpZ/AtpI family protein [Patescibacteria group bacterium]|nr:AtpZ/AtpI family protein [Patescibacteria group bacterium]
MNTKIEKFGEQKGPKKESYRLHIKDINGIVEVSGNSPKKKRKEDTGAWFYLGFVGQIGYAIALPIVGGGLLGAYIDRRLSTYPKATLLLLFVGIVISVVGFIQTIRELLNQKK